MKNSLKLSLTIIVSIIVGFYSAFSLSQVIQIKSLKIPSSDNVSYEDDFLKDIVARVKKDYVEEKTDSQLYEAAADGLLSSLDPHSSFLNPEAYKELQVQTKGEFGGVGIEITMEFQLVKVVAAIDDTPASKVGIKSGDYISRIDGKTVVGLKIEEIVKKLRGKPGTNVKVTILRKGEKAPLEKIIRREIIKVKAVKFKKLGDVAYIKINSFSEQTISGLTSALEKLEKEIGKDKLKGLVLDLRNNPGGLLDQSIAVSDAFLDEGKTIVSIKGRNKDDEKIYKDSSNQTLIPNLPIVVLINEGSASASEIVSGALQDNKRAVIMGIKSFGKGSVQHVIPLPKNQGALRLTTSLYYTPSGKSIQAHGIDPDISVESAKIQKDEKLLDKGSEADLNGHLEVQIQSEIKEAKKDDFNNSEIYDTDYQLARALDLINGLNVYNKK